MACLFYSDSLIESSTKEEAREEKKTAPPKSSGGLFDDDDEEDDLFASVKTEKKTEPKKGNLQCLKQFQERKHLLNLWLPVCFLIEIVDCLSLQSVSQLSDCEIVTVFTILRFCILFYFLLPDSISLLPVLRLLTTTSSCLTIMSL